jgi:Zn-dependent protease
VLHDNGVLNALIFVAVLAPSIIFHEVSHGLVAHRLGDPTARDAGRLTLNPVKHVDPFGSILLPAMLALARQNVFGWAKPVPVNPARFVHPTRGMAVTALAGPLTNILLCVLVARLGPFEQVGDVVVVTSDSMVSRILLGLLVVNAALAVFNMLPIPPLDGSRLLPLVLNDRGRLAYSKVSQYGFLILFALIFIFEEALSFLGDWISWLLLVAV